MQIQHGTIQSAVGYAKDLNRIAFIIRDEDNKIIGAYYHVFLNISYNKCSWNQKSSIMLIFYNQKGESNDSNE